MKTALPHNMTPRTLKRRIHRFNILCVLHGSVLAGLAALFWAVTVYIAMVSVVSARSGKFVGMPWFDLDAFSNGLVWGLVVLLLAFIVWIGFFHAELFFSVRTDPDLRAVRSVPALQLLSPSWWSFLLGALCFAPILSRLAAAAFGSRISWNAGKVNLTVTVYQYLDDWGDWVPYPVFESQRQAVILLHRLGLVRVSRRFGKHQVKLIGGMPNWKKKLHP